MRQDLEEEVPFSNDGEAFLAEGVENVTPGEEMDVTDVRTLVEGLIVGETTENGERNPVDGDRDVRSGEEDSSRGLQGPPDFSQQTERVPHVLDDFCRDNRIERLIREGEGLAVAEDMGAPAARHVYSYVVTALSIECDLAWPDLKRAASRRHEFAGNNTSDPLEMGRHVVHAANLHGQPI